MKEENFPEKPEKIKFYWELKIMRLKIPIFLVLQFAKLRT